MPWPERPEASPRQSHRRCRPGSTQPPRHTASTTRRQQRLAIDHLDDVLHRLGLGASASCPTTQPVSVRDANRHAHTRTNGRQLEVIGNAVSKAIEERNRDGDGDLSHVDSEFRMQNADRNKHELSGSIQRSILHSILHSAFCILNYASTPCVSIARTLFMSSQTSRFDEGLRSRYAG